MRFSRQHIVRLARQTAPPVLAWTVLVACLCGATLWWDRQALVKQAELNARSIFDRDMLYRQWIASHGGVYVPITEETPPKPRLEFLSERDLETSDGQKLAQVTPAYMTRQVHGMGNVTSDIRAHLTSLTPLNPRNQPDAWEKAVLQRLMRGEEQVVEIVDDGQGERLRYMRPFIIRKTCLECHVQQGYALGEVRGGMSVSVPLASLFALPETTYKLSVFVGIWFAGLCGLGWWMGRERFLLHSVSTSQQQIKQIESNLRFTQRYDRATHLPNRSYLIETLGEIISGDDLSPHAAVLVIDFPYLARLQRALSGSLSEMLLRKAAERISGCLFSRDMVARIGEHRLAIVLRIVEKTNLQAIADKINREFNTPLHYEDEEFTLAPLFGAACAPDEGNDAETLLLRALNGLETGLRDYHHQVGFAPGSTDVLQRKIQLEKDLRRAIRERELQVFFQPQVDALNGEVVGGEALVRWDHPQRGMISPAEFIPLIEEVGLMNRLGEHMLREACLQFARLREQGYPGLRLSVNLSARQFRDPKLVDQIYEAVEESGMQPVHLELEITEGSFIEDFERTVMILTELKSLGVRIAIDDFGTGFSSLSYLSKLPVDTLKIDRSFICEMDHENDVNHIVDAIITLAYKLGFDVVAEGVETAEQVARLVEKGCRIMQGFYYAKPLRGADFEACIASRTPSTLQGKESVWNAAIG